MTPLVLLLLLYRTTVWPGGGEVCYSRLSGCVEILQQVCGLSAPYYRPFVNSNAEIDENLITLMEECWMEDPRTRPDFNAVAALFATFSKHRSPLKHHQFANCHRAHRAAAV